RSSPKRRKGSYRARPRNSHPRSPAPALAAPGRTSHISAMDAPFYTIGHSNRSLDDFIAMLVQASVRTLADVRTVARSRANPQFNAEALAPALAQAGIAYEYVKLLGGLRKRSRSVPPEVNDYWENESFHNYADYAMSEDFRAGFARLRELGRTAPCAIMCAEAVWWRCHRRIIADYLLADGATVLHLLGV